MYLNNCPNNLITYALEFTFHREGNSLTKVEYLVQVKQESQNLNPDLSQDDFIHRP